MYSFSWKHTFPYDAQQTINSSCLSQRGATGFGEKNLEEIKGLDCFQFTLRAGLISEVAGVGRQECGGAEDGRVKGLRPREVATHTPTV